MRIGQDLTRDTSLEARQYDLLGMDLGDGVSRRMGGMLVLICLLWIALLWVVLGPPNPSTIFLYLFPPSVVGFFGARPNNQQPRRVNLTQWALKIRQLFVGHKPIVNLGRTQPDRREFMPTSARIDLSTLLQGFTKDTGEGVKYKQITALTYQDRPVGRLIESNRRPVMLYGEELTEKARVPRKSRKAHDDHQG